ncbi:MAG: ATP-binding protein [Thiotrichaceae bacterium]|nr:ATP-binding protein [Thiotrichaceae bacterium]
MATDIKSPMDQYSELVILWSLRILLDLKGYTLMDISYGLYGNERAFSAVGLENLLDKYDDDNELSKKKFRKILKNQHKKYHEKEHDFTDLTLNKNIIKLSDLIQLNTVEQQLLSFAVLMNAVGELEAICDVLGDISAYGAINVFSVILEIPTVEVREALSSDGLLNKTGLLRFSRDSQTNLQYQVSVLDEISDVLLNDNQPDIMESLKRFFVQGKKAKLKISDFSYINKDYEIINRYLRAANEKNIQGCNILIYGPPGTGKSELVRTLAKDLDFTLYEVTTTDSDNDAIMYQGRVDAYQLCQEVLKRKTESLILFDEIEDVFVRDGSMERYGIRTSTDSKKGWFNMVLEENPVPAIWVSNVVSHIDEAILRRFDYVMELKTPPKKTRINILNYYTRNIDVSDKWIEKIAINEDLSPGLISSAAKVVAELAYEKQVDNEKSLERVISNSLHAMGYDKNLAKSVGSPISYRPDVLNADYDLVSLQEGLSKYQQGRFCLYGPSGTGKSEFARHLSKILDKTLLVKRASDLLDAYVGMSEKNIKNMFDQALENDALLLLDEADSFLQDRSRAQQSWEVTQVNELLTQMERFEGIFICSTNLMDNLDQASLRRFDLKVKFDYLKPEQGWELFMQVVKDFDGKIKNTKALEKKVRSLRGLTPGDFATVVRQSRFAPKSLDTESLLAGLKREIEFKDKGKFKNIGFVVN